MEQADHRIHLASMGMAGEHEVDPIDDLVRELSIELMRDHDRVVRASGLREQALHPLGRDPVDVVVLEEQHRDPLAAVREPPDVVREHRDPVRTHRGLDLDHATRTIEVREVLVIAAHRERTEPAGQRGRGRGRVFDVGGAGADPFPAREDEVGGVRG